MVAPLNPGINPLNSGWLAELLRQALGQMGAAAPRRPLEPDPTRSLAPPGAGPIDPNSAAGMFGNLPPNASLTDILQSGRNALTPPVAPPLGPDAEGRPDLSPIAAAAIAARPQPAPLPDFAGPGVAAAGALPAPGMPGAGAGSAPPGAGGVGSFTGGGGTAVNTDAARAAGLGAPSTPIAALTGGSGAPPSAMAGMGGLGRLDEERAYQLLGDPAFAMRLAFERMGINPDQNYFAANAMKRYQSAIQPLFELWAAQTGKGVEDINEFMNQFAGGMDVRGMVGNLPGQAATDPVTKEWLSLLGPEDFIRLQQATSGEAPGMAAARARMLGKRVTQRRVQDFNAPDQEVDIDAWMALMGR